ncbi:MAG: hypothetical protein F9K45_01160 [Melioribacteraceae bacterium]|nr:MAG: hypothetical protein F9K45_01160 [Melioribacteraceae bacterium]
MLKLTKIFLLSVLFLSLTNLLSAHTRELQMKIMNSSGNPLAATVYMYQVTTEVSGNKKLTLYRQGNSIGGTTWNWTQPDCNVVCDIDDSNTSPATWNPITYGRYYIRIGSSYCDVYINYYDGSSGDGDFMINYQNGVFSNDVARNNRGITFYGSYTWSASFSITAKNSFGGGDIKFDGTRYNSIPAAGKTFPINATDNPMEASTFPHYVEAIDDGSQVSGGFVQRFENFGGLSGSDNLTVRTISTPSTGTVTANFEEQFNITFINSVVGLGNVGTLRIDG